MILDTIFITVFRDYYGLVKSSHAELSRSAANKLAPATLWASSVTIRMVRWALARNLSTLPPDPKQAHIDRFQQDLVDAVEKSSVTMNNVRYDVLWGAEGPPARGNYTRSVPSAPVFDAQPTSSEAHNLIEHYVCDACFTLFRMRCL